MNTYLNMNERYLSSRYMYHINSSKSNSWNAVWTFTTNLMSDNSAGDYELVAIVKFVLVNNQVDAVMCMFLLK